MNIKKTIVASLLVCMLPAAVMAKDLSVGVSMALFDDNFLTILRTAMQKEMQKEGVKSQVEDAKGDVAQQLQQVQNFIGQGVDAIIVNPVDTNAVKPIIDQATKAGIPLVFVNRRPQVPLTDKMAYVGSDSVLAGRLQMEALAKAMNGKPHSGPTHPLWCLTSRFRLATGLGRPNADVSPMPAGPSTSALFHTTV